MTKSDGVGIKLWNLPPLKAHCLSSRELWMHLMKAHPHLTLDWPISAVGHILPLICIRQAVKAALSHSRFLAT